jgi:uncharacterized protein YndB with AHSA1/START domain
MTEVERTVELDAGADEVWDALTDAALLDEWFDGAVDVDLQPGGALRVTTRDHVREGVVEDVDAPHRLTFTWADDDEQPGSTVEFVLEPLPGGCRLRVREALIDVFTPRAFPIGFQPPPRYRTRTGEARALARS